MVISFLHMRKLKHNEAKCPHYGPSPSHTAVIGLLVSDSKALVLPTVETLHLCLGPAAFHVLHLRSNSIGLIPWVLRDLGYPHRPPLSPWEKYMRPHFGRGHHSPSSRVNAHVLVTTHSAPLGAVVTTTITFSRPSNPSDLARPQFHSRSFVCLKG